MPVWRFAADEHAKMRAHDPFEHSKDADGNAVIVPRFHFLAEGQKQHDGSFIVHFSRNVERWLRREGFNPEHIHNTVLTFPEEHHALGKEFGIWSVWQALGGAKPNGLAPDQVRAKLAAEKKA